MQRSKQMFVEEIRDEDTTEAELLVPDNDAVHGKQEHPWKSINDCILALGTAHLRPTATNTGDANAARGGGKKSAMTLLEAEFIGKATLLHDKQHEALQRHIEMKREVDTDVARMAVRRELREYFRRRVVSMPKGRQSMNDSGTETRQAMLRAIRMHEARLRPVEYEGFIVVRKPDFV